MKKIIRVAFIPIFFVPIVLKAQVKQSSKADSLFKKMMSEVNTKHAKWVRATAKEANEKKFGEPEIRSSAITYAKLGSMTGGDIDALVFMILMETARSAEEDLRAIAAEVKETNKQKQEIRDAMEKMKGYKSMTRVQLDSFQFINQKANALKQGKDPNSVKLVKSRNGTETVSADQRAQAIKELQDSKDSLSEQSEMQQLRMQMIMDRMTKADSAASNVMKKFSETASQIIQNLK